MELVDSASWYTKWCEPVVWSLYLRDADSIKVSIAEARHALATEKFTEHDINCLKYQLAYLEFQAQPILLGKGWKKKVDVEYFTTQLVEPSRVQAADYLRRRLYLQMRLKMDRTRIGALETEEMQALLSNLPDEENTAEVWLYLAEWAFRRGQNKTLSRAYEFAVTNARGFQISWNWRRVEIMWRITNGTASRENVKWLIDSAHIYQQLDSLKRDIIPRAAHLGLVDAKLISLLNTRRDELAKYPEERVTQMLKPHTQNKEITNQLQNLAADS